MKTFYFTANSDGDRIVLNAEIDAIEADTLEQAGAKFLATFARHEYTGTFVEGRFSDCWIKASRKPDREDLESWCAPLAPDQVIVCEPGTHPGGKAWWITPSVTVWVGEVKPLE